MEEGEVSEEDIVEVDLGVCPGVVEVLQTETDGFVGHQAGVDELTVDIDTAGKPSTEQVDAHDAEDEPEDKADQKDVEDGWDCLDQCVHHHLHANHHSQ